MELAKGLSEHAANVVGIASIFWIIFQKEIPRSAHTISSDGIGHYNRLHDRVLQKGYYLPPSGYEVCFLSAAMTDEMLHDAAVRLAELIREEAHLWA
jgi:glutamate-1-semialdehyde 2,1-aminomutase